MKYFMGFIKDQKHIFALYTEYISFITRNIKDFNQINTIHEISGTKNQELIYRISVVLRLNPKDKIILFDNSFNAEIVILKITLKKAIIIEILNLIPNKKLEPFITWCLPILKKAAFEESLYNLGQLGIQVIQVLITDKSQNWFFNQNKEILRSEKILVAASEQAKNYNIPKLLAPIKFDQWILGSKYSLENDYKIFFDPEADLNTKNLVDKLNTINTIQNIKITGFCGPEGDLSLREKELLKNNDFNFYSLTPTILRAQEAVTIGAGIIRSITV